MIHTFRKWEDPVAQLAAAEQAVRSYQSYFSDEYKERHDGEEPPKIIASMSTKDLLLAMQQIGARLEFDGREDGDGFHHLQYSRGNTVEDLHVTLLSRLVNSGFVDTGYDSVVTFDDLAIQALGCENMVLVPDETKSVARALYFLTLIDEDICAETEDN